jgi:hypothetical protein
MDLDLETCFLAFLIGFALYLLVNRVFIEGYEETYNPKTGEGINPECLHISVSGKCDPNEKLISCMKTTLGKDGQKRGGVPSCGVDRDDCKGPTQIWCGNDWGKKPGQSPSPSPNSPPTTPFDLNDTENFINYLKFEDVGLNDYNYTDTIMSINWAKMKSDSDSNSNNNLYSRIRGALARGEDVRFTEHSSQKSLDNLIIDKDILSHEDEEIDLTLSFVVELLKFIDPENLKILQFGDSVKGDIGDLRRIGIVFRSLEILDFNPITLEGAIQKEFVGDISVLGEMGGDSPVFPSLTELDLSNTSIHGDISVLGDMGGDSPVFPQLTGLDLSETNIYGNISVLSDMGGVFPSLDYLVLSHTGISGDISVLGDMGGDSPVFPKLTDLDLSETNIYGNISVLGEMRGVFPSLDSLVLSHTGISGDISVLGEMGGDSPVFPSLTELDLGNTSIHGDISVLGEMGGYPPVFPQLDLLFLSHTGISGDISVLGEMGGDPPVFPSLIELDLDETDISGRLTSTILTRMFPNSDVDLFPEDLNFTTQPDYYLSPQQ